MKSDLNWLEASTDSFYFAYLVKDFTNSTEAKVRVSTGLQKQSAPGKEVLLLKGS